MHNEADCLHTRFHGIIIVMKYQFDYDIGDLVITTAGDIVRILGPCVPFPNGTFRYDVSSTKSDDYYYTVYSENLIALDSLTELEKMLYGL